MKNHLLKFLLVLLISTFVESYIVINNIKDYECQNFTGVTIFNLEAISDSYLPESIRFDLEVENIIMNCSFPELQPNKSSFNYIESDITDYTEVESYYFSDGPSDSDIDTYEDSSYDSTYRLLQESDNKELIGVCMILEQVKKNIILNKNNIKILNNNQNISFKDDFSFSLDKCEDTVDETNEFDLTISFKQLSNYHFDKDQRKITFLFFGSVTSSLPKGYPIEMDVYLIRNGFQDQSSTKANCILTNDIIGGNGPVPGQFNCSIENINGNEDIDSCVFDKSDYIAGVPNDKVSLNPFLSDLYIFLKLLVDFFSGMSNVINGQKSPSFKITDIDHTNCGDGKFTLKGEMSDNFTYNMTFELPMSFPENATATCTINETTSNVQTNIDCQTNSKIDNQKIQIAQNSIFDENKNERFLIEKFESNSNLNCKNSKIISLEQIVNYYITFRQASNFGFNKKVLKFKFIGLAFKNIKVDDQIHFKVLLNNNGKQYTKDIICSSESNVNPAEGDYAQVTFNCQADVELDNLDKVVIISSSDVSGLEDIQDYQKDPNETDYYIKNTEKNNENGVGKVIDYSKNSSYVPILEIISINTDKCSKKGKITINGVFNQDITKKFDFEIPLSYPSSTIRCTAPKTKRRVKVSINCKTQTEFYNKEKFIIEPRIIYQKYKEILYIKKYNSPETNINCADFNQLEKETSLKKYNSDYTFIQTNNFNIPTPGKITFRIIIYRKSPELNYKQSLPLKIAYNKRRSTLRNLDDDDVDIEEEDINADCSLDNESTFGYYNCSANTDISNKSDVTNFYIESDDISGLFEGSSNPIETDQQIKTNLTINYNDVNSLDNFIILTNPSLNEDDENPCNKTGQFTISGNVNKSIKGNSFYIDYLNPPDIGAYCTFKDTPANNNLTMTCHNEDDFVYENIIIDNQLIGGKIYIDKPIIAGPLSCLIGDEFTAGSEYQSLGEDPSESQNSQNSTISDNEVRNQYYSKSKSSQGLSGGAITAIVIVSAFVLIGIGVLIALIKNGVFAPKPPINNSTSIPPLTNSSANII